MNSLKPHHVLPLLAVIFMATLTPSRARLLDLSHKHSKETFMSTPDMPKYKTNLLFQGDLKPGVFVQYNEYSVAEHGGTHLDAPVHFNKDGLSLSDIPLEMTIADGVMIDCSKEVGRDPVYKLTLQKVLDWEETNGRIPPKAAVVLNMAWSDKFLNSTAYLNPSDPNDPGTNQFPTVSEEAIDFLVDERDINIIALDTISPDLHNTPYPVHVKMLFNNRIIAENVKDPGLLPAKGFRFHASPVKFVGATGVQTRIYAIIDEGCKSGKASVLVSSIVALVFSVTCALYFH